jgi:hypothetical protein
MELIMQQNQNWPFPVNEMMGPYFDAYNRYLRNVFNLEPVLSGGMDKNNMVEKQFNVFIQNTHHTLDYIKEMMFIFEHNFENNLSRAKKGNLSSTARTTGEESKSFSDLTRSSTSKTKTTKSTKSAAKKNKSSLAAKSISAKNKQIHSKSTKGQGTSTSGQRTSTLRSKSLKKEAPKKTSTLKASDHPFSLGERNKDLLENTLKTTPTSKNTFTDKKF